MAKLAHVKLAGLAYQLALMSYDKCASKSNEFFKVHPNAEKFAKAYQAKFIPLARQAFAALLNDSSLNETQKDEICEILFMDRTIPGGEVKGSVPLIVQ